MTKATYHDQVRALTPALKAAEGSDAAQHTERAVALVRDFGRTYAVATRERQQRIRQVCFDQVVIEKGMLVAVRPRADIAPLFAAAVCSSGPDRGQDRQIELLDIVGP